MNHEWPISLPSTRSMKSCCWTACPRLGTAAWCKWWHRSCGWVPLMRSTASLDPRTRSLQDPSVVGTDIASGCWPRCSRSAQCGRLLGSGKCFHHRTSRTTCCTCVTDGQISVERSMSLFGWIIRRSCQPEMLGLLGINSPWTITHGERDKLFGQISTVPIFDV